MNAAERQANRDWSQELRAWAAVLNEETLLARQRSVVLVAEVKALLAVCVEERARSRSTMRKGFPTRAGLSDDVLPLADNVSGQSRLATSDNTQRVGAIPVVDGKFGVLWSAPVENGDKRHDPPEDGKFLIHLLMALLLPAIVGLLGVLAGRFIG